MTDGRLSSKVLKAVKESTDDSLTRELLTELLYEEAEQKGQWHWKQPYREKIKEFTDRRAGQNAD